MGCGNMGSKKEGIMEIQTDATDSLRPIHISIHLTAYTIMSVLKKSQMCVSGTVNCEESDDTINGHMIYLSHRDGSTHFYMSDDDKPKEPTKPGWHRVMPEDMVTLSITLFGKEEQVDNERKLWTDFNNHIQETLDQRAFQKTSLTLLESAKDLPSTTQAHKDTLKQSEENEVHLRGLLNYLKTTTSSAVQHCKELRHYLGIVRSTSSAKSEIASCYVEAIGAGLKASLNKAMLRGYHTRLQFPWGHGEGDPNYSSNNTTTVPNNTRRLVDGLERYMQLKEIMQTYWKNEGSAIELKNSLPAIMKQLDEEPARKYRYITVDPAGSTQTSCPVLGSQQTIPKFGYSADKAAGYRLRGWCLPSIASAPGSYKTPPNLFAVREGSKDKDYSAVISGRFDPECVVPKMEDGLSFAEELRREFSRMLVEAETALVQIHSTRDQVVSGFTQAKHDSESQLDKIIQYYQKRSQAFQSYMSLRTYPDIWDSYCKAYTAESNRLWTQQAQLRETEPDLAVYSRKWLELATARCAPEIITELSEYELERVYQSHPNDNFGNGGGNPKSGEDQKMRESRHEEQQTLYQLSQHQQKASLLSFYTAMKNDFNMLDVSTNFEEYVGAVRLSMGTRTSAETGQTSIAALSTTSPQSTFSSQRTCLGNVTVSFRCGSDIV
jgi:hypothetical protein